MDRLMDYLMDRLMNLLNLLGLLVHLVPLDLLDLLDVTGLTDLLHHIRPVVATFQCERMRIIPWTIRCASQTLTRTSWNRSKRLWIKVRSRSNTLCTYSWRVCDRSSSLCSRDQRFTRPFSI